jgi:hypothetical protein
MESRRELYPDPGTEGFRVETIEWDVHRFDRPAISWCFFERF